jgi:hypothetical protein
VCGLHGRGSHCTHRATHCTIHCAQMRNNVHTLSHRLRWSQWFGRRRDVPSVARIVGRYAGPARVDALKKGVEVRVVCRDEGAVAQQQTAHLGRRLEAMRGHLAREQCGLGRRDAPKVDERRQVNARRHREPERAGLIAQCAPW